MPQRKTIESVKTSLRILETIKSERLIGVTAIANKLGKPKSTVQIHLNTLWEEGYVVKESDGYQLGGRFVGFGVSAKYKLPEFKAVEETVEKVAYKTGEQAQFVVHERGTEIVIHCKKGDNAVKVGQDGQLGQYLHATAAGKAILAFLPAEEREAIIDGIDLQQVTEQTVSDPEELREELAEIRERGFAFNDGEHISGLRSVGVPIIAGDQVIGGLSVTAPAQRMSGERYTETIPDLLLDISNEFEVNRAVSPFEPAD